MDAARLRETVVFTPILETEDPDFGGPTSSAGTPIAPMRAHFKYLRHGEAVVANRLAGRSSIIVTIRANAATLAISQNYQMRDEKTGRVYNVTGYELLKDRKWLEIMVVGGDVA